MYYSAGYMVNQDIIELGTWLIKRYYSAGYMINLCIIELGTWLIKYIIELGLIKILGSWAHG